MFVTSGFSNDKLGIKTNAMAITCDRHRINTIQLELYKIQSYIATNTYLNDSKLFESGKVKKSS